MAEAIWPYFGSAAGLKALIWRFLEAWAAPEARVEKVASESAQSRIMNGKSQRRQGMTDGRKAHCGLSRLGPSHAVTLILLDRGKQSRWQPRKQNGGYKHDDSPETRSHRRQATPR